MKIRLGFVSNSSSSSFICIICGHSEVSYDNSPEELGFAEECQNGHVYCVDHAFEVTTEMRRKFLLKEPDFKVRVKNGEDIEELYEEWKSDDCITAYVECPVCTLKNILYKDFIKFVCRKFKTTETKIGNEIRSKYKNLKEFQKAMK